MPQPTFEDYDFDHEHMIWAKLLISSITRLSRTSCATEVPCSLIFPSATDTSCCGHQEKHAIPKTLDSAQKHRGHPGYRRCPGNHRVMKKTEQPETQPNFTLCSPITNPHKISLLLHSVLTLINQRTQSSLVSLAIQRLPKSI